MSRTTAKRYPAPMRARILALVVFATSSAGCGSCVKNTEFYCEVPSDCESGRCDVDHNVCLAAFDGPVGVDASADATPDGMPDAAPIIGTLQAADLVVGQPDFVTDGDPGCSQAGIRPASVSVDNGILYVGGFLQSRAVAFSPIPTASHANATRVLGQSQFTICTRPASVGANNI